MALLRVMALINGLGTGGAERSLAELMPRLRERGVEVEVVCSYRRVRGVERQLVEGGFQVTHLESNSAIARLLELRRHLRRRKPDLLHTMIIESDLLGRLSAVGMDIPVVSSLVNTSYDAVRLGDPNVRRWKMEAIRALDAVTARRLTVGFHALTETVARQARTELGVDAHRVTVIGRGRDMARLGEITHRRRQRARQVFGIAEDDEVVLAVGRQEFQKGQVVLVEAAALLAPECPRLRVLLAGRHGSESQLIRGRIEQLGLGEVVMSLGHREDIPDLFAAADLFALPSRYEGFGGSLLEAMALGVPAVVSDLPALREVGGDCVRYVAPGDVESWASTLAAALADRGSREDLAACARARVRASFDIERVADAHAVWYRQMATTENDRVTG